MAASVHKKEKILEFPLRPAESCKVLIADDDERIVEVFSIILAQDGYQMLAASDAQETMELAFNEQPDVVVLDVILPDQSGIEVCRKIKNNENTRFMPIILVTGDKSRSQRLEGLNAGADDFLDKPVDPVELTARVRSLLRSKQLHDEVDAHRKQLEERVAARTRELQAAYERLQDLNRVKSNILAIVSHELRTPLVQVKSALNLALKEGLSDIEKDEVLTTATQAFSLLEYRIADVGVFSDPADLKLAPVSVKDIVLRAIDQVRELRRRDGDKIDVELLRGLKPVLVDSVSMTRALVHIIHNAVKFGNEKTVEVIVTEEEKGIQIVVKDQGSGIPLPIREHLFLPLQPGDTSFTRPQGGLGIGLALVKMILDAHNASLDIQSQAEKGTTVTMLLPFADM